MLSDPAPIGSPITGLKFFLAGDSLNEDLIIWSLQTLKRHEQEMVDLVIDKHCAAI